MDVSVRKEWVTPQLSRFGTFAELTQGCKEFGTTDGWTLAGDGLETATCTADPS